MKIRTLGVLAAVGMMLSSVTVWSLTDPRPRASVGDPEPTAALVAATSNDPSFDKAAFTSGKTLMLEGRLGHAQLLADRENESFLFVNVSAENDAGTTAQPLNLAVVIDRSGSMKGKRLSNAISAARGMVRRLREGDVVSVVAYSDGTEILSPPTTIDESSRERVVASLDRLTARGDTCISCGIDAGVELLRQRSGMLDRMLLLTDGEATAGVRDLEGFRRLAESVRRSGAAISSIGVDVDYNERVLSALAQESNGRHYFAENDASLARIFDDELSSLVRTVGRGAELSITLAPGVQVEQVFDRSFRREGDRLIVPLGDFASGEQKTLLAKLRIPRGASGERGIADVRLAYQDLAKGTLGECNGSLSALLTDDAALVSPLDPIVSGRMNRSQTASVLTDANQLFASGQVGEARRRLSKKLDDLKTDRSTALRAAPPAKARELEKDFARQEAALGAADDGFASAPTTPPAAGAAPTPAEERKGKAQVRSNQKEATDLAF